MADPTEARTDASEKVLRAAMQVFAVKGFYGANTDEVATAAGVSKGLVFRYFGSKDELLAALLERWLREAFDFWDREPWEGAPAQQLARVLALAVERAREEPDLHRLYLALMNQPGQAGAVRRATEKVLPQVTAYYARIARLFAALGSDAPEVDAKLFQFAVNGLVQTMVVDPSIAERPKALPLNDLQERLLTKFIPPDSR